MFFKKKKYTHNYSQSLSEQTWIRFKRDKLSMFGLFLIGFATTISILGYWITPDSSPYANDQKPELHIKKPGFMAKLLLMKKNEAPHNSNIFNTMAFGNPGDYTSIPYYAYTFKGFDIIIEEYTGNEPNNGSKIAFNLAEVVYDLNNSYQIKNDTLLNKIEFHQLSTGSKLKLNVSDLQAEITKHNLITKTYILGTDLSGRDLLSRLAIGTRISLSVGFISVIISIVIGVLLGSMAGYFRGWIDDVIMWIINIVWSIPTLLLVIAITLVLGKGVIQVFSWLRTNAGGMY